MGQATTGIGICGEAARAATWPSWTYRLLLLCSAAMFATTGALAKIATQEGVGALAITFGRVTFGLICVTCLLLLQGIRPQPRNVPALLGHGVANVAAVFLFYQSIKYTTITSANLLNCTYPLFVAMLSGLVLGERLSRRDWMLLATAGVGVCLVLNPRFDGVNPGDLIALGCGAAGGAAVIFLRMARRVNTTATVLLFLFSTGAALTWPALLREDFSLYTIKAWAALAGCVATGVTGQLAITLAFRHVSAFAGALTGSSQVVLAAMLGVALLGETLTWHVAVGTAVVLGAIVALSRVHDAAPAKVSFTEET